MTPFLILVQFLLSHVDKHKQIVNEVCAVSLNFSHENKIPSSSQMTIFLETDFTLSSV
jgi:hypothetical protein